MTSTKQKAGASPESAHVGRYSGEPATPKNASDRCGSLSQVLAGASYKPPERLSAPRMPAGRRPVGAKKGSDFNWRDRDPFSTRLKCAQMRCGIARRRGGRDERNRAVEPDQIGVQPARSYAHNRCASRLGRFAHAPRRDAEGTYRLRNSGRSLPRGARSFPVRKRGSSS